MLGAQVEITFFFGPVLLQTAQCPRLGKMMHKYQDRRMHRPLEMVGKKIPIHDTEWKPGILDKGFILFLLFSKGQKLLGGLRQSLPHSLDLPTPGEQYMYICTHTHIDAHVSIYLY